MTESEERVRVEVEDRVARVTLNRPDKRNGLDLPMFEGLIAAGERVMADRSVRAVVLSGEGKAFCAGLDFAAFMALGDGAQKLLGRPEGTRANVAQRVAWIWQEVPVPVIAAVHGAAFGGGLQIALGADIRLVAPDAQLCVMEIRYGLIPDMSITLTLPRLAPLDVIKELTFTGRIVSGVEAVRLGLATRVAEDPRAEAMALAREIAARSPHAVRAAKRLLNEAPHLDPRAALLLETELQLTLLGSANQMRAVQAVMTRTDADFEDPT